MAMTKAEEAKALADNMHVVRAIAKKYKSYGVDFDDLVQEGAIGFVRGMRKWSPEGGASLRNHSAMWAQTFIRRAVGTNHAGKLCPEESTESLDGPIRADGGQDEYTLHSVLPSSAFENPEEAAERSERIQMVRDAAASLTQRESAVLSECLRGSSNEDIGQGLGVSRERIRQIRSEVVELVTRRVSRAS